MDPKRRAAAAATVMAVMVFVALGMLVAGASGSFDARAGSYKGKTAQGFRVSFEVEHHKVKNPEFKISYGCGFRMINMTDADKINDAGKFKIIDANASFKGKFVSRSKVRGEAEYLPGTRCSATVGYQAHHR